MGQEMNDTCYRILEGAYNALGKVEEILGDSPGIAEKRKAGVDYMAAATRALSGLRAYINNVPKDLWETREITPRTVQRRLNRIGVAMGFTREQLDQGMARPALLVKYLVKLRGEKEKEVVDDKGNV